MIDTRKKVAAALASAAVLTGGAFAALPAIASANSAPAPEPAVAEVQELTSAGSLRSTDGARQDVSAKPMSAEAQEAESGDKAPAAATEEAEAPEQIVAEAQPAAEEPAPAVQETVYTVIETPDAGIQTDEQGREWSVGSAELIVVGFEPPAKAGYHVIDMIETDGGYMVFYEEDGGMKSGKTADGDEWAVGPAELIEFVPYTR